MLHFSASTGFRVEKNISVQITFIGQYKGYTNETKKYICTDEKARGYE
jgi:hypothetical protein